MESGEGKYQAGQGVTPSEAQKRAQRRRNIAIGLCLGGLVLVFYGATISKFGPKLMDRPVISLGNQ